MKVLILSCSTGGGHNACAKYIEEELKKNNIDAEYKDFFKIVNRNGKDYASKLYLSSLKFNGKIFSAVYKAGLISPVYLVNKIHSNALLKYINENKIDIVITTHLFPSLTLTNLNSQGHNIKFIFITTDYECSPFYEEAKPNYLIIPKGLKNRYIKKNVDKSIIRELGIPVSSTFIENAHNIREKYKIKENEKIVLMLLGSMGFGNATDSITQLAKEQNIKVIVICGTNKKLLEELKSLNNDNIIPLGFTKNVNDFMYSSDVILSKPGGLSSTEIGITQKPLIHIFPIPGVETYNTKFFFKHKMSLIGMNNEEIVSNTLKVLNDKDICEQMIKNQEKYINRNSCKDIVKLVTKLYKK